VDWEPVVLAYYHRELAVLANLWTGDLQYDTFKAGRLHLAKINCLEVPGGSLKTRESRSSTRGSWQPGYMALPKSREALTGVPKWARSEGSTLIKEVNPLQRPRDPARLGTFREAVIMSTNNKVLKNRTSI
jgi:hypothetical protein